MCYSCLRATRTGRSPRIFPVRQSLLATVGSHTGARKGIIQTPARGGHSHHPSAFSFRGAQNRGARQCLLRERDVIQEPNTGLTHVLAYKKPGLACVFLRRRLHSVASTKQALLLKKVQDELKDITAVEGKQYFPTLADCQPYSVGGGGFNPAPAGPRSISRSVRGCSGGRRGRSSNGGSCKPPIICDKCTTTGQSANHSHRIFPLTECFKYHQKGHVIQNCPN